MNNSPSAIPLAQTPCQQPDTLRVQALRLLQIGSTQTKAAAVRELDTTAWPLDVAQFLFEPPELPGRPARPVLVQPGALRQRAVGTLEGRASLIHALTHIEANAINLALDIVWRFDGMPQAFYMDWLQVAQEEALHFELLEAHLRTLGFAYGDFPAHDGLWDMAARTRTDLLARLALVPRTLEARGLDATPPIQAKLRKAGDLAAVAILDVILRDEIGHVAIGNHWYGWLCRRDGLDPEALYPQLVARHAAPRLRRPFNLAARRAAGFSDGELAALDTAP